MKRKISEKYHRLWISLRGKLTDREEAAESYSDEKKEDQEILKLMAKMEEAEIVEGQL